MADNWEKIVDGARDVAGTVAGAAGDIYGKGKEYVLMKKVEWQLRDKYCKLGKLQYRIEQGEEVDLLDKDEIVRSIIKLHEELKSTGGKENKYDYITCESCGSAIPDDSKFCPGCGKQL